MASVPVAVASDADLTRVTAEDTFSVVVDIDAAGHPLLHGTDFDRAEAFFDRHGPLAVLVGRCIPLVRSFVSIPAGIAAMPLAQFTLYTTIGSLVWNGLWIGLGYALGPAMEPVLTRYSGLLSNVVVVLVATATAWFVVRRVRRRRRERTPARS